MSLYDTVIDHVVLKLEGKTAPEQREQLVALMLDGVAEVLTEHAFEIFQAEIWPTIEGRGVPDKHIVLDLAVALTPQGDTDEH